MTLWASWCWCKRFGFLSDGAFDSAHGRAEHCLPIIEHTRAAKRWMIVAEKCAWSPARMRAQDAVGTVRRTRRSPWLAIAPDPEAILDEPTTGSIRSTGVINE
jgi:hypothetical protein